MSDSFLIKIEKYYKTNAVINENVVIDGFNIILKLYVESPDYYMADVDDRSVLDDWIHINIGSCECKTYITYDRRDISIEYPDVDEADVAIYTIKIVTATEEDREVIFRKLNYLKLGQS